MSTRDTSSGKALEPELTPLGPSKTDWARLEAMTDQEAVAGASRDPDNPEWSDAKLEGARQIALVKHIRFKLGLGRTSFARRYHIDESLIAAWERHEAEPDAMARAYLHVIAADPEGVARTLASEAAE